MKTFGELDEIQSLENDSVLAANNPTDTMSNKIKFVNLKSQILNGVPTSKNDIGLGNVENTGDSSTPAQNGTEKFTTGGAYTLKEDIDKAYKTDDSTENNIEDTDYIPFYDNSSSDKKKTLWSNIKSKLKTYFDALYAKVHITSPQNGDMLVYNSTDDKWENKQVSYTASDVGAIPATQKGANSGVAELDENGKVPSSQLPSFVDDVLEYTSISEFPTTGETGKIYVDTTTNKTYRWSGTAYVEISPSLALGETSSTAYRGDRGKTAYDHSQIASGNPHNVTKSDVGLGNVGNFKAVSTVASQGLSNTEKSNARANIGAGTSSSDTKNTAGSTDTSSKIFLVGATSQAANPQTYSDNEVFTTSGVLTSKKLSTKALIALTGSGTAGSDKGSGVSPRYIPTLWTFNSGVTVANGEVYFIKIPTAGGTYGVWLSLNNGTNYYPVAINSGKSRFTTHYGANTVIAVTYESAGVCNCYARAGADSTADVTGIFRVLNDYDANTTYSAMSTSEMTTGTATTSRVVRADYLKSGIKSIVSAEGYTKNTGTVTSVATGVGLTGGTISKTGTIKAKLKSETASTLASAAMGSTSSRQYAVGVDKDGNLSVNIPWIDHTKAQLMSKLGFGVASSSWIYNIKITSTSGSGQIIYLFTPSGYIELSTSGQAFGAPGNVAMRNVSAWTYTKSKLTITLNCTEHSPCLVFGNDPNFTVTFTDKSTPQSTALSNSWATSSVVSTSANGLAPKVTDTSKFLKGDGTWATPTNTTYSAGAGLKLSGTTFSGNVPRVAKNANNSLPGKNTWILEEFTSGSNYGLPSNAWYFIFSMQGADANYGAQLAIGMTTTALYYRNYYASSWQSWVAFRRPTGNATAAQVLSGYTFSNASSDGLTGNIPVYNSDNGSPIPAVGAAVSGDHGVFWIPYGYYANAGNNYNLVHIPNNSVEGMHQHGGTYTYSSGSTGGTVDLGLTHGYRYVNATNVYNKGKADGTVQITAIGSSNSMQQRTISATSISGYKNLTVNNFLVVVTKVHCGVSGGGGSTGSGDYSANLTRSYNASTGVVTVSQAIPGGNSSNCVDQYSWVGKGSGWVDYTVYCVR